MMILVCSFKVVLTSKASISRLKVVVNGTCFVTPQAAAFFPGSPFSISPATPDPTEIRPGDLFPFCCQYLVGKRHVMRKHPPFRALIYSERTVWHQKGREPRQDLQDNTLFTGCLPRVPLPRGYLPPGKTAGTPALKRRLVLHFERP